MPGTFALAPHLAVLGLVIVGGMLAYDTIRDDRRGEDLGHAATVFLAGNSAMFEVPGWVGLSGGTAGPSSRKVAVDLVSYRVCRSAAGSDRISSLGPSLVTTVNGVVAVDRKAALEACGKSRGGAAITWEMPSFPGIRG